MGTGRLRLAVVDGDIDNGSVNGRTSCCYGK